jgi:outer membrane protein
MKRSRIAQISLLAMAAFAIGAMTAAAAGTELTLEESIQLALKNNRDVKIAEKNREEAYYRLQEAKGNKLPSLSFIHTDGRTQPNPAEPYFLLLNYAPPVANYFNNQLNASLPLYAGGQLEGYIKQAGLELKNADLSMDRTKQQVKLDVTVAYYNVLQAKNIVKANEETVDRLAAHLKNVQARFDAEIVTKNDVLRSEVELSQAQQNLAKARNGHELAKANLNYVLGLPLTTEVNIQEELSYEEISQSQDGFIEQALQNRPEVAQSNINCQLANNAVSVAKGGYLPKVSLVGTVDRNDLDFPGNNNQNWSLSLISKWDIYSGGQTISQVNQAKTSEAKAQVAASQVKETVRLEVLQAYLNLKEARQRIDTSKLVLDKANEDYQLVQARYGAGLGTNLDVMDSQLSLTTAKTDYINALYDYNVNLAKLKKAAGM